MPSHGDSERSGSKGRSGVRPWPLPVRLSILILFPFLLSLFGGWLYVIATRPTSPPPRPGGSGIVPPPPEEEVPGDLAAGDDWLYQGRSDKALAVYRSLSKNLEVPSRYLLYRMALCQEAQGLLEEARANYSRAAEGDSEFSAAARLGQARVLVRMKKPAPAKEILYRLLLLSGEPRQRDNPALLAEIRYWLGLALVQEASPSSPKSESFDEVLHSSFKEWPIDRGLDLIGSGRESLWLPWSKALVNTSCWPAPGLPFHLVLAELAQPGRENLLRPPARDSQTDSIVVLKKDNANPENTLLHAVIHQKDVRSILEELLSQSTSLEVRGLSDAAVQQKLLERSARLNVHQMPLRYLLTALTEPLGVVWEIDNGIIQFLSEEQLLLSEEKPPGRVMVGRRMMVARRALRDAVLADPDHPLKATAYLEQGNLEADEGIRMASVGKFDQAQRSLNNAVVSYQRLLNETPNSQLVVEAHYNLGIGLRRLEKVLEGSQTRQIQEHRQKARKAFLNARDHAPGQALEPLAYFQIGRIELEEGTPEQAVKSLLKADAAPKESELKKAVSLQLAAAYLLTGSSDMALNLLRENSALYEEESYRPAYEFLLRSAQFFAARQSQGREAKNQSIQRRDTIKLFVNLRDFPQNASALGPIGPLLVLQAYRELGPAYREYGLANEYGPFNAFAAMEATYRKALKVKGEGRLSAPIAAEMCFILAETAYAAEQWETAEAYFDSPYLLNSKHASHAKFRLAAINYHNSIDASDDQTRLEKLDACLNLCQELRQQKAYEESLLLKMMGKAYSERADTLRKQGKEAEAIENYRRAAACFELKPPE